ncbi:prepilin-type N-terminal cleavage/methylation domain-containing protein [Vreelandella andesensis]|uniref:Type II secretion system protein H n=1 Tax=Vreelandella andesensis TaxID=447567 RepID=A0A3S0XYT9_9GAMM|nr:GspH/FimT family pseudopilin [Halomonas andesensis]RUR25683.1 prepilin-type N-terminal cleavage/methylation domain-containing protein [Halomonas andesensis]
MPPNNNGLPLTRIQGFTLIELVIALLLISALAAWGMPNFQALGRSTAITADINRLQSAFSLARNTAITQRKTATVCPTNRQRNACTNDWSNALLVFKGEAINQITSNDVIRVFPAEKTTTVTYNRSWRRVSYSSLGHTDGFNGHFYVCAADAPGKVLVLSRLGRLRIDETPADC